MSGLVRVYVNERPVDVAWDADAAEAVRALDAGLAAAVADGRAYLTDGRGIRLAPDTRLAAGAILRVVRSGKRETRGGADGDDAHA